MMGLRTRWVFLAGGILLAAGGNAAPESLAEQMRCVSAKAEVVAGMFECAIRNYGQAMATETNHGSQWSEPCESGLVQGFEEVEAQFQQCGTSPQLLGQIQSEVVESVEELYQAMDEALCKNDPTSTICEEPARVRCLSAKAEVIAHMYQCVARKYGPSVMTGTGQSGQWLQPCESGLVQGLKEVEAQVAQCSIPSPQVLRSREAVVVERVEYHYQQISDALCERDPTSPLCK